MQDGLSHIRAGRSGPARSDDARTSGSRGTHAADHSVRNACITSTRAARHAGIADAVTAASSNTNAEPATGRKPVGFGATCNIALAEAANPVLYSCDEKSRRD